MPVPSAFKFLRRAAIAVLALATPALGQVSENVDTSLLETWRLNSGNVVRFCQYESVPTFAFDRAVGQAIADRLLTNTEFLALGASYGIGGEYAAEDLFVTLTNDCDVMLGMGLASGMYPVEFIATRAYVGFPYVLAVADPEIERLTDIAGDRRLGAPVGSYGLVALVRYSATLPEAQRWQVLPYGDMDLMTTRLLDGTIAGMVVYGPSLVRYQQDNTIDGEISVLPLDAQIAARVEIGGLMLARNGYLRTLIDQAIALMVEDGTITALLAEYGFDTLSPAPGGYQ